MDSNYIITADGSFISDHELYHHGILGMKWGIRRYQNSDGSLTAAGRKRYTNPDGTLNKKGQKYYAKESERLRNEHKKLAAQKRTAEKLSKLDAKRKANEDLKNQLNPKKETKGNSETPKKKSISEMTDEELNAAINRARMEDTYKQLRPEPVNERSKFMKKMLNDVVVPGAVNAGKAALQKMIEKAMKDQVDPNSYEALKKKYDKLDIQNKYNKLKKEMDKAKNENSDEAPTPKTVDDLVKYETYRKLKRENDSANSNTGGNTGNSSSSSAPSNVQGDASRAKQEIKQKQKEATVTNNQGEKAKKATEQSINSIPKKKTNSDSSPFGDDYEKRVDKLLKEMDDKGWERWYKEYGDH